jgi:hypothetical protein
MTTIIFIILAAILLVIIVLNQKILRSYKDDEQIENGSKFTNINRLIMQNTIAFLVVVAIIISWFLHLATRYQ